MKSKVPAENDYAENNMQVYYKYTVEYKKVFHEQDMQTVIYNRQRAIGTLDLPLGNKTK